MSQSKHLSPVNTHNLGSDQKSIPELVRDLENYLFTHRDKLFRTQHRDGKKKRKFSLKGSFKLGTGSTNPGNLQHVQKKPHHFVRHQFRNTAAYVAPVKDQKKSRVKKEAYRLASEIILRLDPDFAAGDYLINFSRLNDALVQYVKKHIDKHDIAAQLALGLGDYTGAALRIYDATGNYKDVDYRHKVVKFDGRLPHEVVFNNFTGERFAVIFYKNYDSRKNTPDPIFPVPEIVYEMPSV